VRRRTDREEGKTLAKERMPGISDLDVSPFLFLWVLEGGIELIARLRSSIMNCSLQYSMSIFMTTGFSG
jgi:hypothetical protein